MAGGAGDVPPDELVVRLATEADQDWCCCAATLAGRRFAAQRPGQRAVVVATRGGAHVGLLILDYLWAGIPEPQPFVSLAKVVPGHQRRGVGRALLDFAESYVCSQGYRVLFSSSTMDEPEPQRWHRRMGFEQLGQWQPFAGLKGEVFFAKRLEGTGAAAR